MFLSLSLWMNELTEKHKKFRPMTHGSIASIYHRDGVVPVLGSMCWRSLGALLQCIQLSSVSMLKMLFVSYLLFRSIQLLSSSIGLLVNWPGNKICVVGLWTLCRSAYRYRQCRF